MSEQHEERLQKALARAGIASRRGSEELIMAGRVKVNGKIITELGTKIDASRDKVSVDDEPVAVKADSAPQKIYIVLNKPTGYLSTVSDPQGRPTIMDLVDQAKSGRLFPVGRLDADTEGLLLLTNDGAFANALSHPRFGVEKEYVALLDGIIAMKDVDQLRRGVTIPVEDLETGERVNHLTKPARVELIRHEGSNSLVRFILKEGKKRQIRLMADAVDHPVVELRRVRLGTLKLADLGSGKFRNLSKQEIKSLQDASKPNPDQPEVTFTPPAPSRPRPSGPPSRVEPFKSIDKPRRFGERNFGERSFGGGEAGRGGPRRGPGPNRFERDDAPTGRPTAPRRGPGPDRFERDDAPGGRPGAPRRGPGPDRGPTRGPDRFEREDGPAGRPTRPGPGRSPDRFERDDAPGGRPTQPGRGFNRGPQSGPGRFEREEFHSGRPSSPRRGPGPDRIPDRFERDETSSGRPAYPRRGPGPDRGPGRFEREDGPTGRPDAPRRGPGPGRSPDRGPDRYAREESAPSGRPAFSPRSRPESSNDSDSERGRGRPAPAPRRGPAGDGERPVPPRPFRAPGSGGASGAKRSFSRPNPNGFVPAAERSAPSPGRGRAPFRKGPNTPESPRGGRPGGRPGGFKPGRSDSRD